ncbi:C2H2 zinc finger [Rhizoctonia solani]|uniref:C2H2 zinc finger n=1 Tax=Rhizoctonia solani TaxID=456999 RepID=A0A8H8NY28_9AGAM|nr:C2H2 zinc finger [Rhizoctonia solani]QRW20872.1 C2H2 zinc finger [Rhizoctonia solani]
MAMLPGDNNPPLAVLGANPEKREASTSTPMMIAKISPVDMAKEEEEEGEILEYLTTLFSLTSLDGIKASGEGNEREPAAPMTPIAPLKNKKWSWWQLGSEAMNVGKRVLQATTAVFAYSEDASESAPNNQTPATKDERSPQENNCELPPKLKPSASQCGHSQSALNIKQQSGRVEEEDGESEQGSFEPRTLKQPTSAPILAIKIVTDELGPIAPWNDKCSDNVIDGKLAKDEVDVQSQLGDEKERRMEAGITGAPDDNNFGSILSPCEKDGDLKKHYYFDTPRGSYYFDNRRNLYSESDGWLATCSLDLDLNTPFPHFCIGDAKYWFHNGLWVLGSDNIFYPVELWMEDNDNVVNILDGSGVPNPAFAAAGDPSLAGLESPETQDLGNFLSSFDRSGVSDNVGEVFPKGVTAHDPSTEKFISAEANICEPDHTFDLSVLPSQGIKDLIYFEYPQLLAFDKMPAPEDCTTVPQPDLSLKSQRDSGPALVATPVSDTRALAPKEVAKPKTPELNSYSLQRALQGNPLITFSPNTQLAIPPCISYPTAGDTVPNDTSLFAASSPPSDVPATCVSQDRVAKLLKAPAVRHVVKKRKGVEHRRCPVCSKVFRRPCSLVEHIRVHTGEKPYGCPFMGCTVAFATKQNMKRHFLGHQAGPLENYTPYAMSMLSETSLFDKNAKCNETEWGEEHPTNDRYMPYGPAPHLARRFRV